MPDFDRRRFGRMLLMAAAVTAVVCFVILFFFRTTALTGFLHTVGGIFTPFIYGFAIAYILRPVALFIEGLLVRAAEKLFRRTKRMAGKERKKGGGIRIASVLLALAFFAAVILAVIFMVLPEVINSLSSLISQIPGAISRFSAWLDSLDYSALQPEVAATIESIVNSAAEQVTNFLQTSILPSLNSVLTNVTSGLGNILTFLKNFGLGMIISAYFLSSWETFVRQAKMAVCAIFPEKAAGWIRKETLYANRMFSGFINGKILDSAIIGIICFGFMTVARMPYAVLISLVVGVTNIIPFFGPYLGAIPSALLVLTVSPVKCLVFLVFILILQQFDGNILGPRILGDRLGISSFWILFSIMIFGSLFGIVGMIIGAPLFAVIYDIIRDFIHRRLAEKEVGQGTVPCHGGDV